MRPAPAPTDPISLDPDHHLYRAGILLDVFADHRMQPGHAGDPVGQLRLTQPPARLVLQLDIVVVLGPIVADEQQLLHPHPPQWTTIVGSQRETTSALINECSSHHT